MKLLEQNWRRTQPGGRWGAHALGRLIALLAFALRGLGECVAESGDGLERGFAHPPGTARPWVYWFWMDGNITWEGITADLEAMERVGIGGALLMDITLEIPPGPVDLDSQEWRELFGHAVREAGRLGLQLSLNDAPGWSGSGGPWITPEHAMQKLVWAKTNASGPAVLSMRLPRLPTFHGYVRDVATLAFPATPSAPLKGPGAIQRSGSEVLIEHHQTWAGMGRTTPSKALRADIPATAIVQPDRVVDLTGQVSPEGELSWQVPAGAWTILRLGSLPTGRDNPPARPGGFGLECDKLSKAAVEFHFESWVAKLKAAVGGESARALAMTHIDSWEIGFQNWTPGFREEFARLRGYDPQKYLPAMTGRYVGSPEITERFLWDVRRTIADLLAENYAGHLADLSHRHGMTLSAQAYGLGPFDNLLYASRVDVPMSEFWNETDDYGKLHTSRSMASAAHTYGKQVVAAESFSAWPINGAWRNHPFSLKPLADAAFCEGVNRLVMVRFAHQPWLDRPPGMTMGIWGVHYERTQTWWEQSKPWHEYLTRCQWLLQQGLFVADLCYLTGEGAYTEPPMRDQLEPALPPGYDYDLATPEVVLTRMSVRDGWLVLPDGMSYTALVLPPWEAATPGLLRKLRDLLRDGATIVGPRPTKSPSLTDFPKCDEEVSGLAAELWQNSDGKRGTEVRVGNGRLIWGKPLDQVLNGLNRGPDFMQLTPTPKALRSIHRRIQDADFYFVANPNSNAVVVECQFRVAGKRPELWHPDSGAIDYPGLWRDTATNTVLPLRLDPRGSVFVAFRQPATNCDPVVLITRNGLSDTGVEVSCLPGTNGSGNSVRLTTAQPGRYEARFTSGRVARAALAPLPVPLLLTNQWEVEFQPGRGAPAHLALDRLIDWTRHSDPNVRHFSGSAGYRTAFTLPGSVFVENQQIRLDLGDVQVVAAVRVNGHDLGVLWKPPFVTDIARHAVMGTNRLEVIVVNLWPNRLIGDEALADDCEWQGTDPGALGIPLARWPNWLVEGKPRPSARIAFPTRKFYRRDSPLLPSGLLGPATIQFRRTAELN